MDQNATRPIAETRKVIYRCPCGNELTLDVMTGGICESCQRTISPKSLSIDLASTVSLEDQSFDLSECQEGLQDYTTHQPNVVLEDESIPDPKLLVGKQFGHFEIIGPLGQGGMGQVYRALDTSLQRYVAVKVLRSGISDSTSTTTSTNREIDKLLQEAISQARVSHPNIVTIYYVGKEQGNPFLAMELVDGSTLNKRIAAQDLSFEETSRVGLQIANALRASYELDVIHGDIKPSNVLLTRDGTAKLSDFGMARSVKENKGVVEGGTPNYLAPEILQGDTVSAQSDMYALGVTLYEMTFGELPVEMQGTSVKDWIHTHEETEVAFPSPWPPQLPELWRSILSRMLTKAPEERYRNYDELISDLERLQPHSSVAARFFPRLIAAGVDWATVLLLTIGFQTALNVAIQQSAGTAIPPGWQRFLIGVMTFLPIIVYTTTVYFWRQTIGRTLMHLRVVNQYGLRPSRRKMAVRSLLRMHFPWVVIFMTLVIGTPSELLGYIGYIISGLVLLVDIMFMLFSLNGKSLHDLFARTRVVLDTNNPDS